MLTVEKLYEDNFKANIECNTSKLHDFCENDFVLRISVDTVVDKRTKQEMKLLPTQMEQTEFIAA